MVLNSSVWKQFQKTEKSSRLSQVGERLFQQAKADLEAGRNQATSSAIIQLSSLTELPDQLTALYAGIKANAKEKRALTTADRLYKDALASLDRGDIPTSRKSMRTLEALDERLKSQYTLRVVSQPDTPSGVWRHPKNNSNARNYYIIVEALSPEGKRVKQHITSEEDGKAKSVKMWGIRVPESVYGQIRRDKQDNGIIDNNRFGIKRRGYLAPEYQYPVAGGMITQW